MMQPIDESRQPSMFEERRRLRLILLPLFLIFYCVILPASAGIAGNDRCLSDSTFDFHASLYVDRGGMNVCPCMSELMQEAIESPPLPGRSHSYFFNNSYNSQDAMQIASSHAFIIGMPQGLAGACRWGIRGTSGGKTRGILLNERS
jgi:hypothetical protein